MKVICIDNKDLSLSLTVNKEYECLSEIDNSGWVGTYVVLSDRNIYQRFDKSHFKTLEEIRNDRINDIIDLIYN